MSWSSRPYCAYDYVPHARKMASRRLLWDGALVAKGAHGRRHERRYIAWIGGWDQRLNVDAGDESEPCKFRKRRYANQWLDGWRVCERSLGLSPIAPPDLSTTHDGGGG